jgi:hypothetical protein
MALIAQRLQQPAGTMRACLHVQNAGPDAYYGMVLYLHETAFITLAIETNDEGVTMLRLRQHIALIDHTNTPAELPQGEPWGTLLAECACPMQDQHHPLILGWDFIG